MGRNWTARNVYEISQGDYSAMVVACDQDVALSQLMDLDRLDPQKSVYVAFRGVKSTEYNLICEAGHRDFQERVDPKMMDFEKNEQEVHGPVSYTHLTMP